MEFFNFYTGEPSNLWVEYSKAFESFTLALAALVGGCWVAYRIDVERKHKTALSIDITVRETNDEDNQLTVVEVVLQNIGKVKLKAKQKTNKDGYVFCDEQDKLRHPSCVQVKQIVWNETSKVACVDWHSDAHLSAVDNLGEVNILSAYRSPDNSSTEFWLEPGEKVNLLCTIRLSPGDYLIRVVFVGDDRREDFWTQVVYVRKAARTPRRSNLGWEDLVLRALGRALSR